MCVCVCVCVSVRACVRERGEGGIQNCFYGKEGKEGDTQDSAFTGMQ